MYIFQECYLFPYAVSVPTPSVTYGSNPFAGEPLTMICSFTLHPSVDTPIESRVTWRVNVSAVNLNNDRISNEDNSLTFSSVTTSDTGSYACTLTLTSQNPYVAVRGGPKESAWRMVTVECRWFFVTVIAMIINAVLILLLVPRPNVTVSLNQSHPLYAGSSLTVSCTVAIDPHINNNDRVSIDWNVNNGDRYTITPDMKKPDGSYTSSLIISPAANTDDGKTFTCTGRVTGGTDVQQTKDITLRINGEPQTYWGILYLLIQPTDLLSVAAVNRSLTKIWISWALEEKVHVTHYTIAYSSIHTCFDDSAIIAGTVPGSETMYVLTSLEEGTQYSVNVTATVRGWKIGDYTTSNTTVTSG